MWTSFTGPRSSAKRNTSSITCSPRGSSIQEAQDQRYDPTNDEAGHDREIETKIPPFDYDVARQTTEPEPSEPRPQQADNDERETDLDQPPAHTPAPEFRILIMTRDVALIHVNACVLCKCSFAEQRGESDESKGCDVQGRGNHHARNDSRRSC